MKSVPEHVSIIMDGNGRWAQSKGLLRVDGHKEGKKAVRESTEFAIEKGIKYISFFAFSEENWNRPKEEIVTLMTLMVNAIIDETPLFHEHGIKFRAIGDTSKLPKDLKTKIAATEEETSKYSNLTMIIFISYSGKWDIIQAIRKYGDLVLKEGKHPVSIEESYSLFDTLLTTNGIPDPDLLIRTSGEMRLSNYLLWQASYSELYFCNILWPDFRKTHFQAAIDEFSKRQRRFGKTAEQLK